LITLLCFVSSDSSQVSTRGGLTSHIAPSLFHGCLPVVFPGNAAVAGITRLPQFPLPDTVSSDEFILLFVRLFVPHTPLDQWPGLYVGSIVVPKTTLGSDLKTLCLRWLGVRTPSHTSIRLFSLRTAKRCMLVEESCSIAASFLNCGTTVWIQPDFMLTDAERAALGIVGQQHPTASTGVCRPLSPNGPCEFGTPSSDDDEDVIHAKERPLKQRKHADSPVLGLNRASSLDSASTEVYTQPNDTPEGVVAEPPIILQKATISFPDWLAYVADVVEVDVSPLTGSEFGAKIGFQSMTHKDFRADLWDFEMQLRLPKSARGPEIVAAVAAELAKHPEVFDLVDSSRFPEVQFPRDFIRLST
jgi:hypothetical protein